MPEGLRRGDHDAGGSTPIEDLKVGDFVLSRDEYDAGGVVEPKRVEELIRRFSAVLELRVAGRLIVTTGEHPFFRNGE